MDNDQNGVGTVDRESAANGAAIGDTGTAQDGYDLTNALNESESIRVGQTAAAGTNGNIGGRNSAGGRTKRGPGRPRKIVDGAHGPETQAQATLLTESYTEQADAAAEMIINALNGIAVMLAHTPNAAMSIPEQIMIQPPLSAILSKPTVVKRVAANAPYVALIIGFAMWTSRVAQLRQGVAPISMPTQATTTQRDDDRAYHDNAEAMADLLENADNERIRNELQSISLVMTPDGNGYKEMCG